MLDRRRCLQGLAGAALGLAGGRIACAGDDRSTCTLGIGTYSTKGLPLEQAIGLIADVGYDSIEIAVMPGYDGEPATMPALRCRQVRELLEKRTLRLTALMENIPPAEADAQHSLQLERLRKVVVLARELAPQEATPLVQTVLGGGKWPERQTLFRDRLGDWLRVFADAGVTLAIKPHRGGAMSRPAEAIWLMDQLGRPARLKMVYDYSHYALRDMPLEETIREALPVTAHVALKDAVAEGQRVVFRLPGETREIDYPRLFRRFYEGGYRGDFCCEVSGMVSSQPGYDAAKAARTCYANMSRAMAAAEVRGAKS